MLLINISRLCSRTKPRSKLAAGFSVELTATPYRLLTQITILVILIFMNLFGCMCKCYSSRCAYSDASIYLFIWLDNGLDSLFSSIFFFKQRQYCGCVPESNLNESVSPSFITPLFLSLCSLILN